MASTVMVKPGDKLRPGEVALWEVSDEHPDGEVMISAPQKGEDAQPVKVGRTPAVNARLADGRLVETREEPKPRPAETPARPQQTDPLAFLSAEQRSALVVGGYGTSEAIRGASDEQLKAVPGIGDATLARLREATRSEG